MLVLNVALREMMARMHDGSRRNEVMHDIFDEMNRESGEPVADDDAQQAPPT